MAGTLLGAGLKTIGGIFGGRQQARAERKARKIIRQQKSDNAAWYNQRYNEDATQRADAQRAIQMARDTMRDKYNQAQSAGVVAGATDQSVAGQKAATNQALATTASNIGATADARKDQVENTYLTNKENFENKEIQSYRNQAKNVADATTELNSTAASIAGNPAWDEWWQARQAKKATQGLTTETA